MRSLEKGSAAQPPRVAVVGTDRTVPGDRSVLGFGLEAALELPPRVMDPNQPWWWNEGGHWPDASGIGGMRDGC